jgi:carbonic anhydrase/acetyltransferase-like protein (isoleucine patch superfamily)
MGATIMDGAVIESDVLVAAGSVVTPGKRLQQGGLYKGAPAKRVRDLTQEEKEYLIYSARHYVRLSKRYIDMV